MAVGFDFSSESHAGITGSTSEASFSWSHGGSTNAKGVLIFVWTNANVSNISSVTYGGVTIPAVSGGEAADTTGEPGRCTAFFLGESVPVGTQTVVVNRTNNATVMAAVAITVTADQNTRVVPGSIVLTTGDAAVTEVAVTDAVGGMTGVNAMRFAGGHFGHQTPPTAGANSTLLQTLDIGATCFVTFRETTAGTGSRSVGGSNGTVDDRAIVSLAIAETYAPAPASLSLTGLAASVLLSAALGLGSVPVQGYEPVLRIEAGITIPFQTAGDVRATGYAPTQAFLGPSAGHVSFTGYVPESINSAVRQLGVGALVISGLAPEARVEGSSAEQIPIPAGTLAWAGTVLTLRTGDLEIPIPAGDLVLKGPQRPQERPQLGVGSLAFTSTAPNPEPLIGSPGTQIPFGQPGAITFTGQLPLRISNYPVDIPAGTLSLSGQYVNVAFKTLDCGALVWQGYAPQPSPSIAQIPIPKGTLTYTGLAYTQHYVVAIPLGQLALAAPSMEVRTSGNIEIGAGQLVLTGTSATCDLVTAIPVGTLTLTGTTPVLDYPRALGAGQLTFTGYAVDITGTRIARMGVGSLAWHGHTLNLSTTRIVIDDGTVTITTVQDGTLNLYRTDDGTVRWQ